MKLVSDGENIFLKSGSSFETTVKLGGRFDGEGMTMDLLFDGADVIGKVLGPLVAAAALAQAVVSLVKAIKGGGGGLQIGEDAFNMAAAAACLILAVLALSAACGPALIIGIVVAVVVAIVDFILMLFMRKRKPESPPDDYMEHVVIPFVSALPPPPPAASASPAAVQPETEAVPSTHPPVPAKPPVAKPTRTFYPFPMQARLRGRTYGVTGATV
jgi:hypothetical protein